MSARFRLASVLRVRRIQEEIAKADLVRARGARDQADAEVEARRAPLAARRPPAEAPGIAVVASLASGMSMAADLAAARSIAARKDAETDEAAQAWSGAAGRVRALESLEERHREAAEAEMWRAEQRDLDERAVTAAHRNRGAGE